MDDKPKPPEPQEPQEPQEPPKQLEPAKPMTAMEMAQRLATDTFIRKLNSGLVFKYKKVELLETAVLGMLSLPLGNIKSEQELLDVARAAMDDKKNRTELLKSILTSCTLEPQLVDGPSNLDRNQLSLQQLPDVDKFELFGWIMEDSGFSSRFDRFFRADPGKGRSGTGPARQEIRDEAEHPAVPGMEPAGT